MDCRILEAIWENHNSSPSHLILLMALSLIDFLATDTWPSGVAQNSLQLKLLVVPTRSHRLGPLKSRLYGRWFLCIIVLKRLAGLSQRLHNSIQSCQECVCAVKYCERIPEHPALLAHYSARRESVWLDVPHTHVRGHSEHVVRAYRPLLERCLPRGKNDTVSFWLPRQKAEAVL